MSESTRPGPLRTIIVALCALLTAGIFATVASHSWRVTDSDATAVSLEREGIVYLHPMVALVGQLVQTQSAAVRGTSPDAAALNKNLAAVATAQARVGADLGTEQRFTDLRAQVAAALAKTGSPRENYETWTDVVTLADDLLHSVGEAAGLTHDRDLDSYYVMDAALIRLPDAMVQAGRAADLAILAGVDMLAGDDAIRAAVARYGVAADGEAVAAGLNKSVTLTASNQLGGDITQQLDAFRAAVAAFAPPTVLAQSAGPASAADLTAGAAQVFSTGLPLCHKLFSELDKLLAARQVGTKHDQRTLLNSAAGFAAVYLLALFVVVIRRRRPAPGNPPSGPQAPSTPQAPTLIGAFPLPERGRVHAH